MKSSSTEISKGVHMSPQPQEATDEGLPTTTNPTELTMTTFDASSDERVRRIAAAPEVSGHSILAGIKTYSSSLSINDNDYDTDCVVNNRKSCTLQVDSLVPGLCTEDLCSDSEDEDVHEHEDMATTEFDRNQWKVSDSSVRTVPLCHPLDKNSVFVRQSSALEITERIQCTLRDRSIAASYMSQPTLAKCVSRANIHFRVQLYRGREEYNDGFIVEVQRRDGFDFQIQMDVIAILDSARGIIEDVDASFPSPSLPADDIYDWLSLELAGYYYIYVPTLKFLHSGVP